MNTATTQPLVESSETVKDTRYFVAENGVIYSIYPRGNSNFAADFKIEGARVLVLGPPDGSEGREIVESYDLWESLVDLAKAIEGVK